MAYRLLIKDEAHRDAAAAFDYYESQSSGLGERFLEALVARYLDLSQHPQYYSIVADDSKQVLRDVKLKRFPFVVVFEIFEPDEVIVYAIHNTNQAPFRQSELK